MSEPHPSACYKRFVTAATDQVIDIPEIPKIITPARIGCIGPTGSGKTTLIRRLVKERSTVFEADFKRILYCCPTLYSETSTETTRDLQEAFPTLELFHKLPSFKTLGFNGQDDMLLILDDLSDQLLSSKEYKLVLKGQSRHLRVTLIWTMQDFYEHTGSKVIVRQMSEMFLLPNRSDRSIVRNISYTKLMDSRILPACMAFIELQKREDLKYLLLDSNPRSKLPLSLSLRTDIFKNKDGYVEPLFLYFESKQENLICEDEGQ